MADSGCLRVSQILVNKASGDNVLQVLGNKAQKKLPNRPGFTHVRGGVSQERGGRGTKYSFSGPKFPPSIVRASFSEFRELFREHPTTLRELREWPFHPGLGVIPRLLKIAIVTRFFIITSIFYPKNHLRLFIRNNLYTG